MIRRQATVLAAAFALLLFGLLAFLVSVDLGARAVAERALSAGRATKLLNTIPVEWIRILLAVEDPSFRSHAGVDLRTPGQGWTTLTQGLVKRKVGGPLRGPWGKLRQSLYALALDRHLGKNYQIALFLRSAFFGSRDGEDLVGFEAAAESIYGRALSEISRDQFVELVAMLVGPNSYNPWDRSNELAERVARIELLVAGVSEPDSWTDVYLEGCTDARSEES